MPWRSLRVSARARRSFASDCVAACVFSESSSTLTETTRPSPTAMWRQTARASEFWSCAREKSWSPRERPELSLQASALRIPKRPAFTHNDAEKPQGVSARLPMSGCGQEPRLENGSERRPRMKALIYHGPGQSSPMAHEPGGGDTRTETERRNDEGP